jgi:hypothetical protein
MQGFPISRSGIDDHLLILESFPKMVCHKGFDGSIQCLVLAVDRWKEAKPMGDKMFLVG